MKKQTKKTVTVVPIAAVESLPTRTSNVIRVILTAVGIFIGAQVVGAIIVSLIGLAAGASETSIANAINNNSLVRLITIFLIEVITVWFVYLFLRRYKQTFKTIGLSWRPSLKHLTEALKAYCFYFVIFIAVVTIVSVTEIIDTNQAQQLGFDNPVGIDLLFAFISLVILPPIAEEILFRGFLYTRLKCFAVKKIAAFITSSLFAVAHLEFGTGNSLNWAAAIDTFILSYVMIYVTDRTKSLWPAIIMHTLKNGVAFVTLFVIK